MSADAVRAPYAFARGLLRSGYYAAIQHQIVVEATRLAGKPAPAPIVAGAPVPVAGEAPAVGPAAPAPRRLRLVGPEAP